MKRTSGRGSRSSSRRKRYAAANKRKQQQVKPKEEPKPPLANRLQEIQKTVWKAMAVASCIEYSSDSMIAETRDKPDAQHAAAAVHDLLSGIAEPMENIIDELGGVVVEQENA